MTANGIMKLQRFENGTIYGIGEKRGLSYKEGILYVEGVAIPHLARVLGTPLYVYSQESLEKSIKAYKEAFENTLVCYAVKANANIAIVRYFAQQGLGAEVSSLGELQVAIEAGISPEKILFSGVGKSETAIKKAIKASIGYFIVESSMEMEILHELARRMDKKVFVAIRICPDIPVDTHPYLATALLESKFGLSIEEAFALFLATKKMPYIAANAIHFHLGSQIMDLSIFDKALSVAESLFYRLKSQGINIEVIDVGGGIAIAYSAVDKEPSPRQWAEVLFPYAERMGVQLIIEPGRSLVAHAGTLITRVHYLKQKGMKRFIIVDAGMHTFIRPALYGAVHRVIPVIPHENAFIKADIVGPLCEESDFLAKEVLLPEVQRGDLLAVLDTGAYGFSMHSCYGLHPHPTEVFINGESYQYIHPSAVHFPHS